jgi:hypothetical protein
MQGLIDQLQGKIKSYKKQIEEAEEIAALNLAKFRQTQANLTASQVLQNNNNRNTNASGALCLVIPLQSLQ